MSTTLEQTADNEEWLEVTNKHKALAWSVHLFTATGAVWGLLAVVAIIQHQWLLAFVYMIVAVAVDGLDGTLARLFKVKGALPGFDGALLDNIVDYLNYVVVPALLLYQAELLPPVWDLVGVAMIALSSAYQFCQSDAKTEDHYFKGFPSYWNVVVFYLFFMGWAGWANLAAIVVLTALIFVPIKYIYPSRMRSHQRLTLGLTIIWAVIILIALAQYPDPSLALLWFSLLYLVYYVGMSVYLVRQGR
jgi:phosphatidylcholine synthase